MSALKFPKIGLGTWELSVPNAKKSVINAIKMGYRLIDTAQIYKNEEGVGEGIAESNISRDEIIVATKLFPMNNGPKNVFKSFEVSLKKLRMNYVDLLYVHWPMMAYKPTTTLKAMSQLVDQGKVRHIAVSNFTVKILNAALAVCEKPIAALQIEHHPLLQQNLLRKLCKEKNITIIAYSPLGRGNLMNIPELAQIAKKYSVGIAQVCLAWEMDHGAVPIPKATSEGHLKDNFDAQNLKLDKEDIALIDSMKVTKRFVSPFLHPKWDPQ